MKFNQKIVLVVQYHQIDETAICNALEGQSIKYSISLIDELKEKHIELTDSQRVTTVFSDRFINDNVDKLIDNIAYKLYESGLVRTDMIKFSTKLTLEAEQVMSYEDYVQYFE